ncbi:MAG TPA: hypothetical protein VMT97_00410 [Terriglobales bacterium]|nr:hypothetical protein [Terriglobales bacterium]
MIRKIGLKMQVIGPALMVGLCLSLAAPAHAGRGGMGGGGFSGGGFGGVRGGFQSGGFHGGGSHGGSFHRGNGFHGQRCCVNGSFVNGFVFGSFPAPVYYGYPAYPYPLYLDPVYPQGPSIQSLTPQLDISPKIARETCFASGCYRLQGDGVTTAYEWVWVPAPPPPPPPPSVIPYPNGRYELRGPSRWEWVPNPSSGPPGPPTGPPAASRAPESVAPVMSGLYRWTDENGVTHWTQGVDAIPDRYRPKAKPGSDGML